MTDPIISGRDELGWAKLPAEIPTIALDSRSGTTRGSAAWQGHTFLRLDVEGLVDAPVGSPFGSKPIMHYKYVPRTGQWGTPDVSYAVLTPTGNSKARVLRALSGTGIARFIRSSWEELPTLHHIVNALESLPVLEQLSAGFAETVGGEDYRSQRIIDDE